MDRGGQAGDSKAAWRVEAVPASDTSAPPPCPELESWPLGSSSLLRHLHGEALQLMELKAPFASPVLPEILKKRLRRTKLHFRPARLAHFCFCSSVSTGAAGQAAAGPGS